MPTSAHETLVELFRARPALAAELLAAAVGMDVPTHENARADPADLPDLLPTEYRADAVVVLTSSDEPVLAVVVEVQLGRDGDKRWSWPVYVALRARLRCPVELLVVCPDMGVATWCAAPIRLGSSGSQLVPVVVGPELVPLVTDGEKAGRMPELAVLSALAHGGGAEHRAVLQALLRALRSVEDERSRFLYLELVYAALPEAARRHLEELMSTDTGEELSEFAQWLQTKGGGTGPARHPRGASNRGSGGHAGPDREVPRPRAARQLGAPRRNGRVDRRSVLLIDQERHRSRRRSASSRRRTSPSCRPR